MTPRSAAERPLLRLLGERGSTLTAGEAAARTGAPLELVERELLALAVASGADLRVGNDGTVAYRFPRHLRRRLLARSFRLRLEAVLAWLGRQLFRLIRLSIGSVLVLLVLLVTLTLLVVGLVQLLRSDDGVEAVGGLLLDGLQLLGQCIASLRIEPPGRRELRATKPDQQRQRITLFLESVFSVLFGDGDPNRQLEPRRWRRIGCFLSHQGGAVIAEDLAPLLDLPTRPADRERASEIADAAMLPVLLRFDGRPEVSEQGDLAYHFPSLQVRSGRPEAAIWGSQPDAPGTPSPPLRERRIPFSRTSSRQRWIYGGLSGSLLVLSPMLFDLIRPTPALLAVLAWFSIGYALLLLLLPLLRLPLLRWRNRRISQRNRRRRSWSSGGGAQTAQLNNKRAFARSFARHHSLGSDGLAYTTEEGLLEQQIET
ncbi:hypothetical protein [Synechococcus sp. CS-1328]|uniref:hypothetical protein n=1 Tax=Synechococcus sp. CS-1328 TaxID=2847976 RepID=UPI00223A918B|nr:hypothetical protein [Synechococcus sp. CS-1328]MCT0225475.1 hypothetical protein [Synechococcus sp. CS-1328]